MKNRVRNVSAPLAGAALIVCTIARSTALGQGTAFTYQGQLQNNGSAAGGGYDLQFTLYATNAAGIAIAGPVTNLDVPISNGLFTTTVDFGPGVFIGGSNWLDIAVRTNGSGAFSELTPRQQLTPAPYSTYAESGGTAGALASGASLGSGSFNSVVNGVSNAFVGGGRDNVIQTNGNYAFIGGGDQNTAGGQITTVGGGYGNIADGYIATVGGGTFNTASGTYSSVSGGNNNTAGGSSAAVGGGSQNAAAGDLATASGGSSNHASGGYSTVGGGNGNTAGGVGSFVGGGGCDGHIFIGNANQGTAAAIVGGLENLIKTNGNYTFIGGGYRNTADGAGSFIGGGGYDGISVSGNTNQSDAATIGGGLGNVIQTNSNYGFIGGGLYNVANGEGAMVGGGQYNSAGYNATVGGGGSNAATGSAATVGGGVHNLASGRLATVPGGFGNTAGGQDSFAAGNNASATNDYSFVWSDGSTNTVSTATNQFVARASGGYLFYSDSGSDGVYLSPGSGTWSMMSDRNAKNQFTPVSAEKVLASVTALPMTTWSYKAEHGVRHIGPMAQDFYAAFKVGADNRHIAEVDEGGVALAAIQGLNQKVDEGNEAAAAKIHAQAAQIQNQSLEIQQLQQSIAQLKAMVLQLTQAKSKTP